MTEVETSREKFLGECLIGAVEGGSNYWCEFKPDSYNFDNEEDV